MSSEPPWNSVLKGLRSGQIGALEQLIEASQTSLFVFCLHLTRNRQVSEDLVHDTYLKAFASAHQLKDAKAMLGWLKMIAKNIYLDLLKSSDQQNLRLGDELTDLDELQHYEMSDLQLDALKVLGKLEPDDRLILILIDVQECSYQEAAQTLEIPEGTVKSRLSRAREKFSKLYDGTKSHSRSS